MRIEATPLRQTGSCFEPWSILDGVNITRFSPDSDVKPTAKATKGPTIEDLQSHPAGSWHADSCENRRQ
jgi:hypothetical protein